MRTRRRRPARGTSRRGALVAVALVVAGSVYVGLNGCARPAPSARERNAVVRGAEAPATPTAAPRADVAPEAAPPTRKTGEVAAVTADVSNVTLPAVEWFEFVVPSVADARTSDSPIDLSFLNRDPAGAHGFLKTDGERLVDGRGEEVRLFGSNICDYHAMPPKDRAPLVAKRLRELGINCIRLHYYDWSKAPRGILDDDMQTPNPEKFDQLDWLVHQLKEHGVYVDINLHVARGYAMMPEGWNWMGKGIDRIHRPYLESQKRFARDMLTHVNPYTKSAYVDEPAVAIIELNNENTVLNKPTDVWPGLDDRFSAPLRRAWNEWLLSRYGSTAGLRDAWKAADPLGAELLRDANFARGLDAWSIEDRTLAELTAAAGAMRWRAHTKGGKWYSLQLHQRSVGVRSGGTYTLRMRVRASKSCTVSASLMYQVAPWSQVGASARLSVGTEWRDLGVVWRLGELEDKPVRLNLNLENEPATIEFASASLRPGGVDGLGDGQRPEDGSVPMPHDRMSAARARDWVAFLAARERAFSKELRDFVKDELGAKSLVLDTQVTYGSTFGLVREHDVSDIVDIHGYPTHPRDATENGRKVRKTHHRSMTGAAFGKLEGLAQWRVAGKPFSVTEFDVQPPNDFNSETIPLLAAMAAYQGWSCILEYSWFNFQQWGGEFDYDTDRMRHNFHTTGNPVQMATVPASALLYRLGLVAPAASRLELELPREIALAPDLSRLPWGPPGPWSELGVGKDDAWRARLATRLVDGGSARLRGAIPDARGATLIQSDTGEITVDRRAKDRAFIAVAAPSVRMCVGRVGGRIVELGDVTLRVGEGTKHGFANVTLVAVDGRSVAASSKLLFTTVARSRNKGMMWTGDREGIVDWGRGPTEVESVPCAVALPGRGWKATALDGGGRRRETVEMSDGVFVAGTYRTVWYLIEKSDAR